jgi:hypothetical protein
MSRHSQVTGRRSCAVPILCHIYNHMILPTPEGTFTVLFKHDYWRISSRLMFPT